MPKNKRARTINVRADQMTKRPYSAGEEGIVLTTQVPSNQVWQVAPGEPITLALVTKQTFTVDEGVAGQVLDLAPGAPKVDFLDSFADGEYSANADIVGYFDSDGDDTPDTRIDGTTTVQFNGNYVEDGDFIDSVEVDETSGNAGTKDLEVFVVQRYGQATLQKRNSGAGNVSQALKKEDAVNYAFSSPHDPNTDRQITWGPGLDSTRGVLPPKFNLDVVYYDNTESVDAAAARADNLQVRLPMKQRAVRDDEDPSAMRRRVTQSMTDV